MQRISKEQRLLNVISLGLQILQDKQGYQQNTVVNKMGTLGHSISTASFSNIKKGKGASLKLLSSTAKGMMELLDRELDLKYDEITQCFSPKATANWVPSIVPEKLKNEVGEKNLDFTLHPSGRVYLHQKTDFILAAKREIIEVGARLSSFSSYFTSQNENAYKTHIVTLLKKGVDVKSYLLDPDSQEARIYFDDRARVQSSEKYSTDTIKKVLEELRALCIEFETLKLPGKFEIYLYKHIPFSLILVVDGTEDTGKMMASPYLYGVRRAQCPVFEFTKYEQPPLFRTYWDSLQAFIKDARKLT